MVENPIKIWMENQTRHGSMISRLMGVVDAVLPTAHLKTLISFQTKSKHFFEASMQQPRKRSI